MSIVINKNQISSNWKNLATTLPVGEAKRKKIEMAENTVRPPKLTKAVCIDCEMVGIGEMGLENMLARVSIVNQLGQCLYDKYVKPTEPVIDYRTSVSGVTEQHLQNGVPLDVIQKEVSDIIEHRTLVGHAIHNDLKVLFLSHPKKRIRDTQRYKGFRSLFNGGLPSLKALADKILGLKIQTGAHDSVEDAAVTMQLYVRHRREWEKSLREKKFMTSEEKHKRIRARQKEKILKNSSSSHVKKSNNLI
ncbi:unnamed protein product [Rotaria socialis]|uniref:RNA exonuclease 4 n=1 Tax=Rotaria socialis TaxID=392032 RepID=A0A817V171_9BILA|nr:unnamed protein product [Rotaria socialis]CAF3423438.1 unnamed protein product [Rotaria socialis]CAF3506575.1 unnamed protein product [Rotaria socialis]CAF3576979.1 unnamed protein product [Rotaria socialis]CAF3766526.1 unnamed protein product [Rotaria socialis]